MFRYRIKTGKIKILRAQCCLLDANAALSLPLSLTLTEMLSWFCTCRYWPNTRNSAVTNIFVIQNIYDITTNVISLPIIQCPWCYTVSTLLWNVGNLYQNTRCHIQKDISLHKECMKTSNTTNTLYCKDFRFHSNYHRLIWTVNGVCIFIHDFCISLGSDVSVWYKEGLVSVCLSVCQLWHP